MLRPMSTPPRPRNHRELRQAAAHTVLVTYRGTPTIARFACTCGWSDEGNPLPDGQTAILDELVAEMTVYDHAELGHWYLININGHWYANTSGSTGLASRATAEWLVSEIDT
ncbi:MAG: hypothetical protein JWM25_1753 [Thermoleophilia bacterium]|nr:hypothetical protein [Thermoleophilia bacterium]